MCCAIVLFATHGAWAAPPVDFSIADKYIRTDFTVDDGLPDNVVNAVTETDNGLLWLGTDSGLASFDGRTFTPIHLRIPGAASPGAIHALVAGLNGDLWVGSDAGIVRIPKSDLNDSILTDSTAYRLGKQKSDEVEVLFRARDGVIWAGTNHGLYHFDGQGFRCILCSENVSRINQALNGRLMVIAGGGFVEYDGKEVIRHPGLGAQFGIHDDQIFDVFQGADGVMWFCTINGARSIAERRVSTLEPYLAAHTSAYRTYAGRNGTLWVSIVTGIYQIRRRQMWGPLALNLHARSFYESKDGDIWIASNGNGLVHLQPRFVRMYVGADGLPSNITMAVLPAKDGRLWVGCNCGLAVFDGRRFKVYAEKDGLKNSCVWTLAEDQQRNIWIGTYGGGLFRFRDGVFTQYTLEQGLASRIVFQVTVAQDDSLWIATPDGLSHMQGGAIRNYVTSDGLSSNRILDAHQDRDGNIWVATQAGVDRFVSDHFVRVASTQAADEMLANRFAEDAGGNLYTTDMPQGTSQIRNGQLTPHDGALALMEMAEAPDRTLWFSSRKGVMRISEQEFARDGSTDVPLDYEVFNRADGLNTTQASIGSPNIAMAPDGKLWVATVKGLAMIDTLHLPRSSPSPKVFITGVSSDTKRYAVGNELILPPGIHHVELNLAAINMANPEKVRLQYRLEGVDSEWLDANSSRTAVYSNIPSGPHQLLVRVTDGLGHWNAPEVVYKLIQQPHIYARPLFLAGVAIAMLILLLLGYILRVRSVVRQTRIIIEQRQVERETVARELHDTFLQGVQGLILRFHTGTQQLPLENPLRHSFEEALSQSDRIMIEGRGVLSRLRTKRTTPETLTAAYAAIGKELRSLGSGQFDVTASGRSRHLDVFVQEELEKTGREALFNAYRHANAGRIEVEINFGIFDFRVRFRDDGVGIDPAILRDGSVPGHFGFPGMRERVSKIGGKLELWSGPGAGTEIEIRVPASIAYRHDERKLSPRWIRRLLRSRGL